jgi:thiol-disulfide isomerase/thioredoxin
VDLANIDFCLGVFWNMFKNFMTLTTAILFALGLTIYGTCALANEHAAPSKEHKAPDAHADSGHGDGGHADGGHADNGHGSGHGSEEPAAPVIPARNRKYNPGAVQSFPESISGLDIQTGEKVAFKAVRGRAVAAVFVASWCDPCQQLMPDIKNIISKYNQTYVDTVFIFAHDTKKDALGFIKEHKLTAPAILANHELLKSFKNPQIPALYLSDRYQYMGKRFIKLSTKDLPVLDQYLAKLTAF